MKTPRNKSSSVKVPTLGELINTVTKLTHNDRLSALIVADLINSNRVRLEGSFHNRRVVVA